MTGSPDCDKLTVSDCGMHNSTLFNVLEGQIPQLSYGWVCPKCGYVWAIWVKGCENCNHLTSSDKTTIFDYRTNQDD